MDYAYIRGFNYQPCYGPPGLELWRNFDADIIKQELGQGKEYFPKMNAIRLWLSWNAFKRDEAKFAADFDTALQIAASYELVVMPVLFNRWHDRVLDYGGIYIDHFLPGINWLKQEDIEDMFDPYLEMVVGNHADDERIFAWDLCDEPFSYGHPEKLPEIVAAEYRWLEAMYDHCHTYDVQAPVTVGIRFGHDRRIGIERIEPISDILSTHPYYISGAHTKAEYEKLLDVYVEFAEQVDKPLLATETCWGAIDDAERVEIIRYTLGELKKRNIGWLGYLLHHSLIADAHRPEHGPVGGPGNLMFIEADGSLRPGHEIFNQF